MNHKFERNDKYYTVGIYTLAFLLLGTILVKIIWNWDDTSDFIGRILGVLQPFIVGLLIAYLINPLAKLINKQLLKKLLKIKSSRARKNISVISAYLIIIAAIVTALFGIVPEIWKSLRQLVGFVESAQNGFSNLMAQLESLNNKYPQIDISPLLDAMDNVPAMVIDFATTTLPALIPHIYNTSMSLVSGVVDALIAVIVSIYMLMDKPRFINTGKKLVYAFMKRDKADKFLDIAKQCNKIFGNFVIGKTIDSVIIGILCMIVLTIFQIPYALIISVIVGVTNMIPYFGPFIGAIPGIVLLLFVDFKYALLFGVIILVLQQFDGLYLGPKILGESTGLRPIWIIFAITVGGWVAGVAGMFLGVPVVAVIAYLSDMYMEKRLERRKIVFDTNGDNGIIYRNKDGDQVEIVETEVVEAAEATEVAQEMESAEQATK